MIRKWGKRATERFHRFYISSQVPKCQETRSCRTIMRKKKKRERGEREGLQRRVYRSEKEKKIKDMNKNMTPIFLLSCSESSLPAM